MKLKNSKKKGSLSFNQVVQWIIAGVILLVVFLAVVGPTGMKKAFEVLNDKFDIWETEKPKPVVTPTLKYSELNNIYMDQTKYSSNSITKDQINPMINQIQCIKIIDVEGDNAYLLKSDVINKKIYLVYFQNEAISIVKEYHNPPPDEIDTIVKLKEMKNQFSLIYKIEVSDFQPPGITISDIYKGCKISQPASDYQPYCNSFNLINLKIKNCPK